MIPLEYVDNNKNINLLEIKMSKYAQLDQIDLPILGNQKQNPNTISPGVAVSSMSQSQQMQPVQASMQGMNGMNGNRTNAMNGMNVTNVPNVQQTAQQNASIDKYQKYAQKHQQEFAMNPTNCQGNNPFMLSRMTIPKD